MAKLLTLEDWAAHRYGETAPTKKTLRRWVQKGWIVPAPQKHGRAYRVREDARYYTEVTRKPSLAERIVGR